MAIHENSYPALLLNADFRPVSAYPLSTLPWQDAITGVMLGKLVAVEEYDAEVASARESFRLPSVVALASYRPVPRNVPFTRTNIWLRDGGRCVYCGKDLTTWELTFDHVLPRSRGGGSDWGNIVCACAPCNAAKADRTPEECGMPRPAAGRPSQVRLAREAARLGRVPPAPGDWRAYLYWQAELERD